MAASGMIKAIKAGVDIEMTTKVNSALALLTNSMLKVLASTYISQYVVCSTVPEPSQQQ